MAKTVLITGCSSGIGYAAAHVLHKRGYQVIASCRKSADVARLHAEGLPHVVQLDLADSQSITDAVREVLTICDGRLYALFNNGAYGLPGAVEDLTRDALRRQFEVNLFGTHELTRLLIPVLLGQPSARIIQNSSVLGFVAMPNRGAYNASKYALEGLTDTLRLELTGTSIRCSLIEPGPISSRFRENALQAFQREVVTNGSRHQEMYNQTLQRLRKQGPANRHTLPPEAVVKAVIHALESPQPRARYRVTTPTKVMHILKRILSTELLDRFIRKFGAS